MLLPEDTKFLDILKKTHFFILDLVKTHDMLCSIEKSYEEYKVRFQDDALDLDIFKECHETIRQCLNVALLSS